jgi:hypothetical protein
MIHVTKVELYLCKTYLELGNAPIMFASSPKIPAKIGKEFVDKMKLQYDRRSFGYYGDEDLIFGWFKENFPVELARLDIDSYDKLVEKMRRNRK